MQFFTHKYTHTHALKQMINTHMNTHTVSSENHLAPTFFSLCWCRLNSFASCCCPLLNLLVLTPQFLGKTQKFQVRVCAYSFTLLLLLLTLPKTYSFDISKFEYTILNYSLFSLSTRKNYIRISYMLQSAATFFFQHIFTISSLEEFLLRLLILTGERASFKLCSCYI